MASENGMAEEIKDAVNDNEHSIGEKVPGTPFAIVAMSYLAVLALVCLAIGAFIWMMR